jgi:hypothetical protein
MSDGSAARHLRHDEERRLFAEFRRTGDKTLA